MTLEDNEEHLLAQYDAALRRIEQGRYGKCTSCHDDIGTERLEALPYVELCIGCARRREVG